VRARVRVRVRVRVVRVRVVRVRVVRVRVRVSKPKPNPNPNLLRREDAHELVRLRRGGRVLQLRDRRQLGRHRREGAAHLRRLG